MTIQDLKCLPSIVTEATNNAILASVLAHIPFASYWDSVAQYEEAVARYKARVTMPLGLNRLNKRMANLETRQTLVEADLTLLRAQLDREYSPNRS